MNTVRNLIAANQGASLEELLRICMQPDGMPKDNFAAWVECLQEVYNDVSSQPNLGDYAQAIYNVYTDPTLVSPVDQRVTYQQLINGLTELKNTSGTGPAYIAADIQGAVNNYYMQVLITIDTAGLIAASGTSGPSFQAGSYISMTDNHSAQSTGEGGNELNDQDLHPNMTIQWQALARDSATAITLTEFVQHTDNWTQLASLPVSVTNNTYYSRANPSLPPNTTATYAFNFTVAGSSITYWFDPFIGDQDD